MMSLLSTRWILTGLGITGILTAVGIMCWGLYLGGFSPSERDTVVDPIWVIDRSNDRQLAGAAHDIFFGQVIRKSGGIDQEGTPHTQYEVEVLEVIKGSLSGTVTVDQQGGTYADGGSYRVEGDNFLELGESYFFVTRRWKERDWHTLIPEYGDIKLAVSPEATKPQILSSDAASALRERFVSAVENEIPFPYPE